MSRKLDDWLKHWLEYSSAWESPERMRLWAGVSAISAAMQRKCWTFVKGQRLYPNMYVLLVGPPGVGKGNAMRVLPEWMREIDTIQLAPDGLTRRSFFSALEAAKVMPEILLEGGRAETELLGVHHSLTAFIEELGVFLHAGDNDFIYVLCHVYDTPIQFHYKTEHAGENFIESVWFSMLSAVTEKGLKDIFTDQALEMGISARTMIIFSDEKIKVDIFGVPPHREELEKDLKYDLRRIHRVQGEYQFAEDAAAELVDWADKGFPPVPRDPRFEHYNTRRFVQFVKLCMICAAAKRQDPVILKEDVFQAKTFLLDAERVMPQAVITLGANPYLELQQRAIKYINHVYTQQTRGTTEGELRRALTSELDPRYSDMILDELDKAKWISSFGKVPNRTFFPRGKEPEIKEKKDDQSD